MKKFLCGLGILLSSSSFAGEIKYLNLEGKRMPFQRDYFFPEQTDWGYEVTLNFKVVKGPVFLESDLTGQTANERFRNIWWDYTLGVTLFKSSFDLIWDHRSQHRMDWEAEKFVVRDSAGIRINFIP